MLKKVKLNRNGFTLIELLAVIVIMGILMMVTIPSVSRVIENSRKDTMVTLAKTYSNAAKKLWTSDSLYCGSESKLSSSVVNGDYYILIDTSDDIIYPLVESGGKSPWGNADIKGYVRITKDVDEKKAAKYYVAITDGTHAIYDDLLNPKESSLLTRKDVIMDIFNKVDKLKDIKERPFEKNRFTTCSEEGGNWSLTATTFAEDSWSKIAAVVRTGTYPYQVGDTKEVDLGSLGKHTVRVANTSTPAECNQEGFSQTACGFVLEFADVISRHNMNPSGEYKGTTYEYGWNKDGWTASSMRSYLSTDIYNALPADLQSAIIDTKVVSGHGRRDSANFTSTDKLYLLEPKEVYGNNGGTAYSATRQLDYYLAQGVTTSNCSGAIKQLNGSNSWWWLRAAYSDDISSFYSVDSYDGDWDYAPARNLPGVSPAFRIA